MLVVYTDADRLAEHLRQLAPEGAELTGQFCEAIRLVSRGDMRDAIKWSTISVGEFALALRNPSCAGHFRGPSSWPISR